MAACGEGGSHATTCNQAFDNEVSWENLRPCHRRARCYPDALMLPLLLLPLSLLLLLLPLPLLLLLPLLSLLLPLPLPLFLCFLAVISIRD
jgi:hypothetical protein